MSLAKVLLSWWGRCLYAWRFAVFVCQGTIVAVVDLFVLGTQTDGHAYVAGADDASCPTRSKCAVTFHPSSTRRSRFAFADASFVVHRGAISSTLCSGASGQVKPLAVVTGGSVGGIGWATAVHLMLAGVDVVVVCRLSCTEDGGGERLAATLHAAVASQRGGDIAPAARASPPGSNGCGSVRVMTADVGNVGAMSRLATYLVETEPALRIVVCNAGYMAPPPGLTVEGFETQMGTHVVGHGVFLLTLFDRWKRRWHRWGSSSGGNLLPPLRIVIVSSAAAVGGRVPTSGVPRYRSVQELSAGVAGLAPPYDRFQGYRDAKLCGATMCFALARRIAKDPVLSSAPVTVNALHPGPIWSNVVPNSRLEMQWLLDWSVSSSIFRLSPHASGLFVADLCLHRDYDHVSGHYFRMGVDMTRRYEMRGSVTNADSLWSPGIPSPQVSMNNQNGEELLRGLEAIRKDADKKQALKSPRKQSPRRRR